MIRWGQIRNKTTNFGLHKTLKMGDLLNDIEIVTDHVNSFHIK